MPLIPGAPKLPKSKDSQEVYNVGGTNPIIASPGTANTVASSADLELYRKRREAMIERGEDPGSSLNSSADHERVN